MPDLDFAITDAAPVVHALSPMIAFQLQITCRVETQNIQALILQAQVQLQTAQRAYSDGEKGKLLELFGEPQEWGRTLRNRLWAQTSANVRPFTGHTQASLLVPCTYDLNQAATKYFYALESDDIPLLFLFSGSIFYPADDGRLQIQPISWDKEAEYQMPLHFWRRALDFHFPNSASICLRKDVFDRLASHKRASGAVTWEEMMEGLLAKEPSVPEASA